MVPDKAAQRGGQVTAADQQERDREALSKRIGRITHKVLVLSGKGGVGKSTVAASIAVSLQAAGKRVGLLDIDLHGPSIPKLFNVEGATVVGGQTGVVPVTVVDGLKVMSIGFLLQNPDDAVIWRGPRKFHAIQQFLKDVEWGDLDYLIIDSPPGTGDEPLTVAQLIDNPDGAVIVTTPQDVAIVDVRKCINFCRQLGVVVLGVVENMSGFTCPHCSERVDIFKSGGGATMAGEMDVPFLGAIPIDPRIAVMGDAGTCLDADTADATRAAFEAVIGPILEDRKSVV